MKTIDLDVERNKIYKKWVEALRSGYFEQANGVLEEEVNHNCCLGVLYRTQGVQPEGGLFGNENLFFGCEGGLTQEVVNFMDIYQQDLIEMNDGDYCELDMDGNLEDSISWSFDEIADYIEAEYLEEHAV